MLGYYPLGTTVLGTAMTPTGGGGVTPPGPDPDLPDERNYAWLQSRVIDWLHRKDLAARIPDFVTMAEARINRVVHARGMEIEANLIFAAGVREVRLPAGFDTPIAARIIDGDHQCRLTGAVPEQLADSAHTGEPTHWAIDGSFLALNRPVDRERTAVLRYRGLLRLSNTNPNNSVLTKYPDVYLYGTLMAAATWIRDQDSLAMWAPMFDTAMKELNRNESRSRAIAPLRTEVAAVLGRRCGNFYTE